MYLCPSVPLNQTHAFYGLSVKRWNFPDRLLGKESACNAGDTGDTSSVLELGGSPEEEMATHSSILTGRIPWTEDPGGLQSKDSQRAEHE